jgi:hypothetical protein
MKDDTAQWMAKNFPSVAARKAADEAIDKLPTYEPMSVYLDIWIASYMAAGGRTPFDFKKGKPTKPKLV